MIYVICGHLGAGKSLAAMTMAVEEYLYKGKRVASNMTIFPEKALPAINRNCPIKLPSIPRASDLMSLGRGDVIGDYAIDAKPNYRLPEGQTYNEKAFGLVVLDEAGTWLNSREWNDPDRRNVFRWITHARKLGWDVALLVQDEESLDTQIRRSIMEAYVAMRRTDRIKIPFVPIRLPQAFVAFAKYGGRHGAQFKTWTCPKEGYNWYDTNEPVHLETNMDDNGAIIDARGSYSLLSAWHLKGRYLKPKVRRSVSYWVLFAVVCLLKLAFLPLLIVGGTRRAPPTISKADAS